MPRKSRVPSRRGNTKEQEAIIVWTLATQGDINETHAGGNATRTLNQRLKANGLTDVKSISNRMLTLNRRGWVQRVTQDQKTYAIRLLVDPEVAGPNPLSAAVPEILDEREDFAPKSTEVGLNGVESLSVRQQLELATHLLRMATDRLNQSNI